ncbi:hypothetical protein PHMEG_00040201 [Phytophthora megakarya]|uniref:Uncharacterized protein n=1 Tax=Phytophthora megakarya TaxID=4795 RepID=A0A225UDW2_9STRA|nr:hypothetical protein PHMEG_00040201 [Phytophthora megakarya]
MFWNRLDESLWAKYVSEKYYLRAELRLFCYRPTKRERSGSLRRQSPLAQVDSGSLTVADTEIVEDPSPGISSWRHYGILMIFAPSSTHAVHQSAGFPDYAPNKAGGIQPLKQRFIQADVQTLLATEPWTAMFANRVKRLVLHSYSALTPRARMALEKYIRFMEENVSGFWHGGHWFAIDTSTQGGADMQRERKRQWDAMARTMETKQRECVAEGEPSTIFSEAAILDRREPARVQWGTANKDEEMVEHLPKSVSVSLLPEKSRQDNPASRTYD